MLEFCEIDPHLIFVPRTRQLRHGIGSVERVADTALTTKDFRSDADLVIGILCILAQSVSIIAQASDLSQMRHFIRFDRVRIKQMSDGVRLA